MKRTAFDHPELNLSGDVARDAGIEQIAEHHEDWIEGAILEIQRLANIKAQVTADDLRHLSLPHQNCIGAAFRIAAQRKLIQPNGYTNAKTTSCHSRTVRVWIKRA